MIEATNLPPEVKVDAIAGEALHAAFSEISVQMEALGYPVSGDFSPGEMDELEQAFASFVRAMAMNNPAVARLNADTEVDGDGIDCECGAGPFSDEAGISGTVASDEGTTITFATDATETFANLIRNNLSGYTVRLTPLDEEGPEPFDAQLLGPGGDWYDAVVYLDVDDDGDPIPEYGQKTIRVRDIYVY